MRKRRQSNGNSSLFSFDTPPNYGFYITLATYTPSNNRYVCTRKAGIVLLYILFSWGIKTVAAEECLTAKYDSCQACIKELLQSSPREALRCARMEIEIGENIPDNKLILTGYLNTSRALYRLHQYEMALQYAHKAIELSKNIKDLNSNAEAKRLCGAIYTDLNNKENAWKYLDEALTYYIAQKDTACYVRTLGTKAISLGKDEQYDECIQTFRTIYQLNERKKDYQMMLITLLNLANAYILTDRADESFQMLDSIEARIPPEFISPRDNMAINSYLGELLLRQKNYDEAKQILKKTAEQARARRNYEVLQSTLKSLIKIAIEENDLPGSFHYFEEAFNIQDSIASIETKNKVSEMEVIFEVTQKNAEIEKGEYTLVTTLAGYDTVEKPLVINDPEILTIDIEMVKAKEVTIQGTVKNEKGAPLAGVSIALRGTLNYQTTTKEAGSFEMPHIAVGKYVFTLYKNAFEQYTTEINITEDISLDAITLTSKVLPPANVQATANETSATVQWEAPVDFKIFRYDNGKQTKDYGINNGYAYGVMGNVFRQPAKLTAASWYTIYDGYDDHDFVNLFIFDLDANGKPTNNILFTESDIKNNNGDWTTYAFEEPIDCPNGFIVALSVNSGYLALGATEANDEYPFIPETQCSTQDYEYNAFYYMEELGFRDNLMVRAEGIPTGAPRNQAAKMVGLNKQKAKAMEKPFVIHRQPATLVNPVNRQKGVSTGNDKYPAYNVYRLKEGEEQQAEKWTLLTPQSVMAFTYTDEALSTLPQGYYKYAVQAVYTDNRLSEAIISDVIGKDVLTNITIHVSTNVEGASPEKASIKLSNDKNSYTALVDGDGKATFKQIVKGVYQLTAKLKGCKEYTQEMSYPTEASYTSSIQLIENLVTPHNLIINPVTGNNQYQLSWNEFTLKDDFENHKDFEVNSPGELGWNYMDGDGSRTKAFKDGQYEFENMFSPMAFIVFNPVAVVPSMESDFQAHSGNKFLACLGGEVPNDDYLISPELDGNDSFIFKFFALSYDGNDEMEIGYSFNGKEAEDFIWESGTINLSTPKEWKEYSYEMPAGVKFAAVRCVSPDPVIFMIDDVCITTDKEKSHALEEGLGAHSYEVYLNGKKINTQRGITYRFTNLPGGKHIAGIKAIYASGESELATIEFEVTGSSLDELDNQEVILYPNPAKERIFVKGEVGQLDIYGASGNLIGSYINPTEIQVNHLNDGIYTVRMITENDIKVQKIIIRR